MAIVRAVKSGNWSDTTVWNTGALPTSADDVYSNTFTVTIDVSPTVLSISNASATGVTAGGSFVPNNGTTLTCTGAGVVAGATACYVSSLATGGSCTLVANCSSGTTIGAHAANNTASGIMNIIGNCSGSGGFAYGANNNSSGTVNITGNCVAIGAANNSYGAFNNASGILNITGNCTGGGGNNSFGAANTSSGSLSITGICTGGSGSVSAGAINISTGTLTHVGTVQASTAAPGIGQGSTGQITILTGPLISSDGSGGTAAASGVNPCIAARWFPADTALSTFEYRMRGQTVSGSPSVRPARQLFLTDAYSAGYPATGNVRSGTTYGPDSIYTGTCAVPGASSVVVGVPVDNTVGTAAVTAATIRAAVGLANANLDTQLAAIPTTAAPTAAAIRTELDANSTKLANLDATVSSRLPSSSYTAPPSAAPSAADNAAAVWGYSSGRSVTGGTVDTVTNSTPVDAGVIADAVRTELTPELARLSNAATTQEVGDIVEGALGD